jgi:hypothetical protein
MTNQSRALLTESAPNSASRAERADAWKAAMMAVVSRGLLVGYPLVTAQAVHERLTKPLTGRIASVLARYTVDTL